MFDQNSSELLPVENVASSITNQVYKMTLNKSEIDRLESLYKDLLDNCKLDYSLSRYDTHFKAIYDSLRAVVKNENDLYDKLIVLKKENVELTSKFNQAVKLASVDAKVRENLLEKLEKTSIEAAIALNKQKSAIKTATFQKAEILNLLNLSEQNAGLTMRQNYNLNDLNKQKEKLKAECKMCHDEIGELKASLESVGAKEKESARLAEEGRNSKGKLIEYMKKDWV